MNIPRPLYNLSLVLDNLKGTVPLSIEIQNFARANKLGSGDRRALYNFAYSYCRMGSSLPANTDRSIQACLGFFITNKSAGKLEKIVTSIIPFATEENFGLTIQDKLKLVKDFIPAFDSNNLFQWKSELGTEFNNPEFQLSHFQQPLVWIRVRKKNLNEVLAELKELNITIVQNQGQALGFENGTDLSILTSYIRGHFEIQDFNSQQVLNISHNEIGPVIWDCCSGAGGKALQLLDLSPAYKVYCSDIRETILDNLKNRFNKVGFKPYWTGVVNLSRESNLPEVISKTEFNTILADVPCTGSGTWSRSPENLCFNSIDIKEYQQLQRSILKTAVSQLKPGNTLLYITCSVFKEENEAQVLWLQENFNLKLIKQNFYKGWENQSDCMFSALLSK